VKDKLTPKQQRFVEEYLIDLNATQAATRAGYSARTANEIGAENLTKPSIRSAIDERLAARSARTMIDADYVLTTIHETVERCRQAQQVLDRKGNPVMCETPAGEVVPAYTFDATGVLKGCELLGKHLKMFTDKVQIAGDPENPLHLKVEDSRPTVQDLIADTLQKDGKK
jgi:phage terminase small subunit